MLDTGHTPPVLATVLVPAVAPNKLSSHRPRGTALWGSQARGNTVSRQTSESKAARKFKTKKSS